MKHLLIIIDGVADHPHPELDGRTPLAAAHLMNMRAMAVAGQVGRCLTIPEGMDPGSDVGCLSCLGYDPVKYHTGRAPIEAAAMGIKMKQGQVAYRANLVTVDAGKMKDYSAGHISSEESAELIAALRDDFGASDDLTLHAGKMYRHVLLAGQDMAEATCTPPHDITGKAVADYLPKGAAAKALKKLMDRSAKVLAGHPVNKARIKEGKLAATQLWLWGQGSKPRLPAFEKTYGFSGGLISAVDIVKGLGVLTGLDVPDVPGATGYYDTNYEAKANAALVILRSHDFVVIHVEPTDEAGHEGDIDQKVEQLQRFDEELLGTLRQRLAGRPWKALILPDHATPVALRTHTAEPVPYLLFDATEPQPGGQFTEEGVAHLEPVPAHTLVKQLLS